MTKLATIEGENLKTYAHQASDAQRRHARRKARWRSAHGKLEKSKPRRWTRLENKQASSKLAGSIIRTDGISNGSEWTYAGGSITRLERCSHRHLQPIS